MVGDRRSKCRSRIACWGAKERAFSVRPAHDRISGCRLIKSRVPANISVYPDRTKKSPSLGRRKVELPTTTIKVRLHASAVVVTSHLAVVCLKIVDAEEEAQRVRLVVTPPSLKPVERKCSPVECRPRRPAKHRRECGAVLESAGFRSITKGIPRSAALRMRTTC